MQVKHKRKPVLPATKAKQELNKREGLASGKLSEGLTGMQLDPKSENQRAKLRTRRSIVQDMNGLVQERMHQGRNGPWHSRIFQSSVMAT